MKTVLLVARKEILEHLLSLRFHVCAVMMAALLALSVFVMFQDYRVRMENYGVLQARAIPRAGESGVMAVVRPQPLSILARGLDEVLDRGYDISPYLGITPHDRQTASASLFSIFTPPDLMYLVKVLLSLLALLFAYDAVSGEKERGTLGLIFSWPVSRGQVVAGKMVGGLTVVIVPFVLMVGALLVAVTLTGDVRLDRSDAIRLGLMLVAAVCYIAIFFAMGILVSARSSSSPRALVVLLFLWAVIVFAMPNIGQLVAAQISPLPAAESQEALRIQAFAKNRFLAIQSHGRDPNGSAGAFNNEYDRLVEQYRVRLEALVATSKRVCRLSPAASLTYVFTDLAGTGIGDLRRLNAALVQYKTGNLPTLVRQLGHGSQPPPPFQFFPASLGDAWRQGLGVDLILLAVMAAVLFAAAAIAALRTDPR